MVGNTRTQYLLSPSSFSCLDSLCVSFAFSFFFFSSTQSQTHTVSHRSFLSPLCFEFKFTQKRPLRSQHKKKPHNERGGPCRRESRLQYVSHLARSSGCHAVCRRWPALSSPAPICLFSLQISTLHHFQRLVVTLKPSGPTYSDPPPNGVRVSVLPRAHTTHTQHTHTQPQI